MSSENRKKVLLGFGALVVILVAAIALWPPNFRKEDASGAIGEVQKHRAPQITQKDVVLGNETVKHQQKVLYADFLADATKLKALGHATEQQLADFDKEMYSRWIAVAEEVLAEEQAAARTSANRKTLDAEIAEAASFVREHRANLSESDMALANGKLAHIADEEMVRSIINLADEQLAAAVNHLASAKLEDEYLAVAKQLESVKAELSSRDAFALSMADELEYLKETEANARIAAANVSEQQLAERSEELYARAMKNIEEQVLADEQMATKFRDMDDEIARAQRIVGAQAAMASNAMLSKTLRATEEALNAADTEFRSRTTAALGEEIMAVRSLQSTNMASRASLEGKLSNLQARMAGARSAQ